ncbi:MAG: hypothetical protein LIP12_01130 [Clostridiales bacterium]|nr:hypothetical protein [Clostridiales bacterium]
MLTLVTGRKDSKWRRKRRMTGRLLQDQLTEYSQKVFQVTSCCTKMYHMTLPTLRKADWFNAEVIEKFNEMKLVPEMWLNNGILEQLKQVPEGILSYDSLYKSVKDAIVDQLQEMLADPEKVTEAQRAELAAQIEWLASEVGILGGQAGNLAGRMEDMSGKIQEAAKYFDDLYTDACKTEQADQELSEELQKEISSLNEKIKHMNNSEIGMLVVEGVAGVAAIVGTILELTWLQVLTASIVILTTIVSFSLEQVVTSDVEKIDQRRAELDDYTYDLTLIGILKTELEETEASVEEAKGAVVEIGSLWQDLEDSLQDLAHNLRDEEIKLDTELYQDVLDGMEETAQEWDEVVEMARNVRLLQVEPDLQAEPVEFRIA